MVDDCILDSTAEAGKSSSNSISELDKLPLECLAPVEQPISTFFGSQDSSWPAPVSCADVAYAALKDTSSVAISVAQNLPSNVIAIPATMSLPRMIPKDYAFANLDSNTEIVDSVTCTMTCGAQKLFRMENSVKQVMMEMEEVGGLNDERLSHVLGPAVRLLIKKSPLEGYINATVYTYRPIVQHFMLLMLHFHTTGDSSPHGKDYKVAHFADIREPRECSPSIYAYRLTTAF